MYNTICISISVSALITAKSAVMPQGSCVHCPHCTQLFEGLRFYLVLLGYILIISDIKENVAFTTLDREAV